MAPTTKNTFLYLFTFSLLLLIILISALIYLLAISSEKNSNDIQPSKKNLEATLNERKLPLVPSSNTPFYTVNLSPERFVSYINNTYFTLTPGTRFTYEGRTSEGIEKVEVYVTSETKNVLSIPTRVVWDRVWLNDELVEDTRDWYAQDIDGNVWYFGEASYELVDGKVVSNEGSWEAGIDGAQPGIIMKGNPLVGESYRQEYYPGEAEDMGQVLSIGSKIILPFDTFEHCLQTRDWNPLEPDSNEYKYYCAEVGNVVLETDLESNESIALIEFTTDTLPSQTQETKEPPLTTPFKLTEQEAKRIAQEAVDGIITDIEIEQKYGKLCYVVEIDDQGTETDVIIELATGKVLGIET